MNHFLMIGARFHVMRAHHFFKGTGSRAPLKNKITSCHYSSGTISRCLKPLFQSSQKLVRSARCDCLHLIKKNSQCSFACCEFFLIRCKYSQRAANQFLRWLEKRLNNCIDRSTLYQPLFTLSWARQSLWKKSARASRGKSPIVGILNVFLLHQITTALHLDEKPLSEDFGNVSGDLYIESWRLK